MEPTHPPEHFRLVELEPGVWFLPASETTDRPVLGVVAGERATLVVDAGNSAAHATVVLGEIERLGLPPVRWVALTHSHWDHVFGAASFGDAGLIAHERTRDRLVTMAGWSWTDEALDARVEARLEIAFSRDNIRLELPDRSGLTMRLPDLAFTDTLEIDLGGITCRCLHVGGDHADDSVVVSAGRTTFLGDALYPDIHGPQYRYTVGEVERLSGVLRGLPADRYLWGHDSEPTSRTTFVDELDRLVAIGTAISAAGGSLDTATATLDGWRDDDERETAQAFAAGLR